MDDPLVRWSVRWSAHGDCGTSVSEVPGIGGIIGGIPALLYLLSNSTGKTYIHTPLITYLLVGSPGDGCSS